MNIIDEITILGLDVPKEFYEWDKPSLLMSMGGCGPGAFGDYFVPDTVYGMSIRAACAVHDLDYTIGEDKEKADNRFLSNMRKIVDRSKFYFVKMLRRRRILKYYICVAKFGGSSFNPEEKK